MSERLAKAVLVLATEAGSYFSDIDKAEKRAKDVEKAFDGTSKSFEKLGKSFQNWGKTLSLSVTAGLTAVSVAAIAAGQEVDDALDTIRSGTGATGKALEDLEDSFREVFRNVPNTAEEVAEAISEIHKRTGQAGPELERLSTQMLTLARMQKTEVGPLIASTTRLFGDWSIATEKQSGTLDYLFKISQQTGLGVNALAEKVVQFGAPLRQMGFDLETSAALLGKWEKEGVNVELVLGSLRIAAAKFASANIPMREGLEATIQKITELGPGAKATSLAIEVFGRKAGPDMAAAITEGRFAVSDLMKQLEGSHETIMGAAEDTDGFAEKWEKLKHQVVLALEPLGVSLMNVLEELMPLIESGVGAVQDLADWFGKLSPASQSAVVAIGAIAAAAGPAAFLIGTVIEKAATLTAAVRTMQGAASALALGGLGPLGLAIAAVGTGFVLAKRDMDAYIERMEALRQKQIEQQTLLEAYRKITGDTKEVLVDFTKLTEEQKAQLIQMAKAAQTAQLSQMGLNVSVEDAKKGIKGQTAETRAAAAATGDYDQVLGKLTGDQKAATKAAKEQEEATKKLRDAIKALGVVTAKDLNEELAEMQLGFSAARAASVPLKNAVGAFVDTLEDLIKRGKASGIEMGALEEQLDELKRTWLDLANLPQLQVGQSVSSFLGALGFAGGLKQVRLTTIEEMQAIQAVIDQVNFDSALTSAQAFGEEVVDENREAAAKSKQSWRVSLSDTAEAFERLANVSGDSMSEIARDIGKTLAMLDQFASSWDDLMSAENLLQALPAIGSLIALGIEFGKTMKNLFNRDKGRDTVEDFARQFGGFDKLRKELLKLGDEGERLWVKLTQGQGNDVEQAKKAIQEVEEALASIPERAAEAAQAIQDALGVIGPSTAAIMGGFTAKLAPGLKAIEDLKKKRDELVAGGDERGAEALTAKITADAAAVVATNQAEFDRLSRIALAGFNAFVGQGQTAAEAISSLVPAVDALKAATDSFGFSGNAAYDQLLRWRDLATANAPLLEQIGGLNELMTALGTIGALDAQTFADMQAQGVEAFKNLKAAGFSQKEALTQMRPLLESIVALHEERGMAIDEETEALISQAREDGILRQKQIDTNKILMQGLGKLIELLGGELPDAWTGMADDAERAAGRVQGALDGIEPPALEIPVSYRTYGSPGDASYSGDGASAEPEFAWGTPDLDFKAFGRARRAILHNNEAVIPQGSGHRLAAEIAAAMPRGGGGGTVILELDREVLARAIVPVLPDEIERYRVIR